MKPDGSTTETDQQAVDGAPSRSKDGLERKGYDRLWLWFELSRAGWVTIPRVLLHEMPDEWQDKMASLLEEYEQTFTNWPDGIGTRVQITDCGHLTSVSTEAKRGCAATYGLAIPDEWILKMKICHHCQRGELPLQKTRFTLDGERYNELLCEMCREALSPSQIERLNHPAFVLA